MQINLITTLPPRAPRRAGEGPGTATAGGRCRGPGGVFWDKAGGARCHLGRFGERWQYSQRSDRRDARARAHACTRVHGYPRTPSRRHKGGSVVRCPAPGPGGWRWHGAGSLKGRPVCGQPARPGCQRGLAVGTQRRGTQGQRASTGHPPQRPRLQLEGPGRRSPLRLRAHACTRVYARGRGHTPTRARGGTRIHA